MRRKSDFGTGSDPAESSGAEMYAVIGNAPG